MLSFATLDVSCSASCIHRASSLQRDQGLVLLLVMERAEKLWGSACKNYWVFECLRLIRDWKTYLKQIPVGKMRCSNVYFPKAVAVRCVIRCFFCLFSIPVAFWWPQCCPWCPADRLWPCPWCAQGKLWAAQAAALRDRPGSLDMLPQSSFTQIPSLLNFVFHFWFLGDFPRVSSVCVFWGVGFCSICISRGWVLKAVWISQNFWDTRVRHNPYMWVAASFFVFNAPHESPCLCCLQ